MEVEMRVLLGALLLSLLPCFPAAADEIGRGVICDTAEQVEHFVHLRDGGAEPQLALQQVNNEARDTEARNTTACSYAMVMFTRDKPVLEMTLKGRRISILQITVLAFGKRLGVEADAGHGPVHPLPRKGIATPSDGHCVES